MTHSEAEVFIRTVIGPGEEMDVSAVKRKYRDMTLCDALRDYLGDIADYCEVDETDFD